MQHVDPPARRDLRAWGLWLDQTGLRSDASVGTTWAPIDQTPVAPKTGKRFGVNAMAVISNKGELYFTIYTGSFDGPVFLAFLKRLVRYLDRKVHSHRDALPAGLQSRAQPRRTTQRRSQTSCRHKDKPDYTR